MSTRTTLERVVPRARRYAVAVLGERAAADDCVARALAAVGEVAWDDAALETALFRAVHRALLDVPGDDPATAGSRDLDVLDDGVHALAALQRHVLLLAAVEGLSVPVVAAVVGRAEAEVHRLLDAAYADLEGHRRGRVAVAAATGALTERLVAAVRAAGHDVVATVGVAGGELAGAGAAEIVVADVDDEADTPCAAALAAVRALADVRRVVVSAAAEAALAQLGDDAVLVVSKPVDARLLRVALAQALRWGGAAAGREAAG